MDTRGVARAAVALCLASVAFGCGSGDSAEGTPNTFRSRTYGYSVDYPAGWAASRRRTSWKRVSHRSPVRPSPT